MKTSRRVLLHDLAILIKRHPSQEWMKLARLLEEEESRSEIISFLKNFSNLRDSIFGSNLRKQGGHESKTPPRRKKSGSRRMKEPQRLKARLARTSMPILRELALSVGVTVSPSDSRKRLTSRLLRTSHLTLSILDKKIPSVPLPVRTNDYGQWATIILGKQDRKS